MFELKKPFLFGLDSHINDTCFKDTDELYRLVGDNTGNLAFHYAIQSQIHGCTKSVKWYETHKIDDSYGNLAIIPSSNQLGEHIDMGQFVAKFQSVNSPLVSIGLGAQSGINGQVPNVPHGSVEWIRTIVNKAPTSKANIAVRGAFTQKVLNELGFEGKTKVIGCPTLFINHSNNLGSLIESNIREPKLVAVASGHQKWKHLARIEQSLVKIVTATNGGYVGQSPLEMLQITRGEASKLNDAQLQECIDYICPELDKEEFINWSKTHGAVFFDINHWMEYYRRYDFVVGLRIHGVMLALQAGVPALCIVHDSRTLELCETMKVPYVKASDIPNGLARKDLLKFFKFDAIEFDITRKKLADTYVDFLKGNEISPKDWLINLSK
jgi:hypothetical protein